MTIFRRRDIDVLEADFPFYSERYDKTTTAPKGYQCNGADWVYDTKEKLYRIHDWDFEVAMWDDGSDMSFEEANNNYTDLLAQTGYTIFAITRRALYVVGRPAWRRCRERQIWWENMKVLHQWMADNNIKRTAA